MIDARQCRACECIYIAARKGKPICNAAVPVERLKNLTICPLRGGYNMQKQ